jgi:hypothetical protein
MLAEVTKATFEPLIGEKFKVRTEEGTFDFELTFVEELPTSNRASRRREPVQKRAPFALFFAGEQLLPQAMYPMQHPVLGSSEVSIFIVPVGPGENGGYEYEAIFT